MSTGTSLSWGSKRLKAENIEALQARQVDALVSALLDHMRIPFSSIGGVLAVHLTDLKRVLLADYAQAPGRPDVALIRELGQIVERETKLLPSFWRIVDNRTLLGLLTQTYGPREIEVRARPYRSGAGLALRGFFVRTEIGEAPKFVIFLNTAHPAGAVATTFGHELGHYMYGSLVGEEAPMIAFMEGGFASHLGNKSEFFADSFVALAAYNRDLLEKIAPAHEAHPGTPAAFMRQLNRVYRLLGERFDLDLGPGPLRAASRVRYLTSMIHFFKMRRALLEYAGL